MDDIMSLDGLFPENTARSKKAAKSTSQPLVSSCSYQNIFFFKFEIKYCQNLSF